MSSEVEQVSVCCEVCVHPQPKRNVADEQVREHSCQWVRAFEVGSYKFGSMSRVCDIMDTVTGSEEGLGLEFAVTGPRGTSDLSLS